MRTVLIVTALQLILASTIHATTITFNEMPLAPGNPPGLGLPAGTVLSDQFASFGILFSSTAQGVVYLSNASFIGTPPSDNFAGFNTLPVFAQPWATMTITFVDPLNSAIPLTVAGSSLSLSLDDTNAIPADRMFARTFDANGLMIEERALRAQHEVIAFTSGQVTRLELFDNGGDGFVVDNLTYTLQPTHVPEPGTMLLLGAGLVVLGAIRRRIG